ncbi:solute carrier family 2, facilitated glucose transporter member 11-like [Rhineura floridana]|uniref:solute carrier family 2, facilitated glucose transporter member 11-like n=1 Tax=Rhineura floridana TaxID=261503 RepID=UPI002AC7F690|nr:solute carrier family 2, facilitated glucose transporter member 11-like [Rhineura floridana]
MGSSLWDLIEHQKLLLMIVVLGIGGSLQAGFQGTMITYTSVHVKMFINNSWLERSGLPVHPETLTLLWALVVSIFGLGGLLGTLASGYLTTKFGKKKCLVANNVAMLASASLMGFSKMSKSLELILVGRFLSGISTGICIPLHPQYVGEISPKKLRGFANSTASVFWSLGKVLGQVMGQRELLGSASLWPLLMASTGLAASIQLLTLPFFPESPPHLFLQKGDEEGCLKAMKTLWGDSLALQAELDDLRKQQAALQRSTRSKSVLELLKAPALRWQLFFLVLVVVAMQLSGIHVVEYYLRVPPRKPPSSNKLRGKEQEKNQRFKLKYFSQEIYNYTFEVLHTVGFDDEDIPYLSLGLSLSELLSAVVCSFIIDRFGRKVLLWGGFGLMATVLAAVTLTISLQPWFSWMPYCSLFLIFCVVIFFGIGPAGAAASLRMEIFDQSSRSSAYVIGGVLNWVGIFVIGMLFPFVVERLHQFSFLIFMGALYISGFIIYFFLPETKGKSILEIREEFDKLNFKKKQILTLETNFTEECVFCTKL